MIARPRTRASRGPTPGASHEPKSSAWIRPGRRRAIYLRDGLACVYCEASQAVTPDLELTLDHIVARSAGGGHNSTNLVTCCKTCNSSRKGLDLKVWIGAERAKKIRKRARRPLEPFLVEVGVEREVERRVNERIDRLMRLGWLYKDENEPPF